MKKHQYQLDFTVPTAEEIKKLRTIHRDMTEAERAKVKKVDRNIEDALRILDEMDPATLPEELRAKIKKLRDLAVEEADEAP